MSGDYTSSYSRRVVEREFTPKADAPNPQDALRRLVVAVTGITPSAALESIPGAVALDFHEEHNKVPTEEEYRYACGEWAKRLDEIAGGAPPVENPGTITDFMKKQGKPMKYNPGTGKFEPEG